MGSVLDLVAAVRATDGEPAARTLVAQAARALWQTARAAHPEIALAPETFFAHLCARLPEGAELAAVLPTLEAADLYLACACSGGDPVALARFESEFMSRVDAFVARDGTLAPMCDELKQRLRVRLFAPGEGQPPRIAQYAGQAPLGAWVWMTISRLALDLRRAQRDLPADTTELLAERTAVPDPELGYLRAHYGAEFRATYREVLAGLPAREGALLRLHFLEGVTPEQVGKMYGVSRWTASRWIAATCQKVLAETRRRLAARLGVPDAQLDSLIALVRSELALTLGDALPPDDAGSRPSVD